MTQSWLEIKLCAIADSPTANSTRQLIFFFHLMNIYENVRTRYDEFNVLIARH